MSKSHLTHGLQLFAPEALRNLESQFQLVTVVPGIESSCYFSQQFFLPETFKKT
jgi:hypothetical protein